MSIIDHVLAFDIETVPDIEFGRRLHGLDGLTDKQVGYVMQTRQREQTGSEFLSLEQQRIVAISIAMRTREGFKVWSLGEPDSPRSTNWSAASSTASSATSPTLVSWNGAGFDLPVLHYRALRHAVQAPRYWEHGRRRPGVPLEQLPQPLSLAARRPHGRAVGLPGAWSRRASTAWRSCSACPASSA